MPKKQTNKHRWTQNRRTEDVTKRASSLWAFGPLERRLFNHTRVSSACTALFLEIERISRMHSRMRTPAHTHTRRTGSGTGADAHVHAHWLGRGGTPKRIRTYTQAHGGGGERIYIARACTHRQKHTPSSFSFQDAPVQG